jgi:hypothetical protein
MRRVGRNTLWSVTRCNHWSVTDVQEAPELHACPDSTGAGSKCHPTLSFTATRNLRFAVSFLHKYPAFGLFCAVE